MTLDQLKQELQAAFPGMWIKPGAEFDNRHAESLWTGEGSFINVTIDEDTFKLPMFDMYSDTSLYVFGVHHTVHQFLEDRGYYTEAYDGGTFFIYSAR